MARKSIGRTAPRLIDELPGESPTLSDESDIAGVAVSGDYAGLDLRLVQLTGCRVEHAQLTGSFLARSRLTDCVVIGSDLAGLVLEDARLTRVEFRDCRLSGFQAGGRFSDVAFFDCKIDGANFRMTTWEHAEFQRCDLTDSDFYAAELPNSRIEDCDLSGVLLSKTNLAGSVLNGSTLEGIRGADGLHDVTISSDQMIPTALAVFAALNITIRDEPR